MTNKTMLLQIENLNYSYHSSELVLKDVNLTINVGDYLVLMGPNGSGKTTFAKLILGLFKPTSGKIIYGDLIANKRKIGYVPQHSQFDRNFPIKVIDVVMMGQLDKKGLGRFFSKKNYLIAEKALEWVNMLMFKDNYISELSGGQLQRVLIARGLVNEPKFLILDEPTSYIDNESKQSLSHFLKEWNEKITILMITHDVGVISNWAKQVACLNKTLYYHGENDSIPIKEIEKVYGCPIDLVAHGAPHRVLREHNH